MSIVLDTLKEVGAFQRGHFIGTAGEHFDEYINTNTLYTYPEKVSFICKLLAKELKDEKVDIVIGPESGGIILATWLSYHLSNIKHAEVLMAYASKKEGGFVLKRGYDALVNGKKILLIDDVTSTGHSLKQSARAVEESGGIITKTVMLVNKNPDVVTEKSIGHPFFFLDTYKTAYYTPEKCPLCKQKIPLNTNLGHAKNKIE